MHRHNEAIGNLAANSLVGVKQFKRKRGFDYFNMQFNKSAGSVDM